MIKAVLADDERLARVDLKRLLKQIGGVEVIAEFSNAEDFLKESMLYFLILFSRYQYAGMLGIDAAAQLKPGIQFIFCTAYAEYAAQAFDLQSVDYLLNLCVVNACNKHWNVAIFPTTNLIFTRQPSLLPFNDVQRIVRLAQIERFEVVGNELAVHCPFGKSYLRLTMKMLKK